MTTTAFTILYVSNVRQSAQFYADLLGLPIREETPGFAMLALPGNGLLGLWLKAGVQPAPAAAPGAGELALTVGDAAALQDLHDAWVAKGVTMLSPPRQMNFGRNFTAADPDGHRLRMFVPSA